jgi:hypothetical protein
MIERTASREKGKKKKVMTRTCRYLGRVWVPALILTAATQASAQQPAPQQPAPQPAPPAAPAAGGEDAVTRARSHYERGIELYAEENFVGALSEFERAYELAPNYRILYNLGKIHRQLNHYAEAIQAFQSYLSEGGAEVAEQRRREVEHDMDLLKARVASIDVKVNVPDAEILIDDVPICSGAIGPCAGKAPLPRPLTVNPGTRKITAQKSGYQPATSVVRVVGTDAITVKLSLVSLTPPPPTPAAAVDSGPRDRAIVAWAATGAVAIGATVMGVLALNMQAMLRDHRNEGPNQDPTLLANDATKVKTLATTTDIIAAVAVVGGVIATWLTVRASEGPATKEKAPGAAALQLGPGGAAIKF